MRDRTAMFLGALAGAVAGGLVGWLYLSDDGRRLRARLEPRLIDFAGRAAELRGRAGRLQQAASDGWSGLHDRKRPSER